LPFDELPKDFFRWVVGCTFLEILLICRGLGKENIATDRKARPSELNQFARSFPLALRKTRNRGGRHGSIAKTILGNPDAEKA
jgi:hypothetical protein